MLLAAALIALAVAECWCHYNLTPMWRECRG